VFKDKDDKDSYLGYILHHETIDNSLQNRLYTDTTIKRHYVVLRIFSKTGTDRHSHTKVKTCYAIMLSVRNI